MCIIAGWWHVLLGFSIIHMQTTQCERHARNVDRAGAVAHVVNVLE
jgi:hypothetical protein